ncbi:hypothetical protein PIB30_040946 [Stylosanthes scabra]|uniref:Uncharacterized protein n=1 Tax=Stylosanthes scabra TaxID=79078 RepID=A0ABU6QE54_9FABA|nr:hypothetical protein [Stylosanthes scabra]
MPLSSLGTITHSRGITWDPIHLSECCESKDLQHHGASSSSQADLQEPVPLRTAPPIPGKMDKGSLRSKKRSFGAFLARAPHLGMELNA